MTTAMTKKLATALLLTAVAVAVLLWLRRAPTPPPLSHPRFLTYVANPRKQDLRLYWKDEKGQRFGSLLALKTGLEAQHRTLVFATNGGMYRPDHSPQGLYIEDGQQAAALDTDSARGNFYLKPNGVFFINGNNSAGICPTPLFRNHGQIKYATQSGPLLLIEGKMHPAFQASSPNVNIRNGVGILPDNRVAFVMSTAPVTFHELAAYFQRLGCRNALYLDGQVSRTYLPAQRWVQTDGDFGAIIGVSVAEK